MLGQPGFVQIENFWGQIENLILSLFFQQMNKQCKKCVALLTHTEAQHMQILYKPEKADCKSYSLAKLKILL